MSLRSPANKLMIGLAAVIFVAFAAGCTREVIKEVPVDRIVEKEVIKEVIKEVFIERQAEQKEAAGKAATSETTESTGPKIYKVGIFEDLTTTNDWDYLGPDTTIWNSYVLSGGKPALYSLSDQRFDWIPSAATDFPTPVVEETVGGTTFWTTEVELKKGMKWSDGNDVTAEDFIFTAHTVRDLELSGNWASSVDTEFFDHAEALDPYKLKIYFKQKPGLARWQFGLAFMPILSKAFWEPVVEEAKKEDTTVEQQRALYAHVPKNEPSAGGYIFKKWENAGFAEKVKNPDYYFEGS